MERRRGRERGVCRRRRGRAVAAAGTRTLGSSGRSCTTTAVKAARRARRRRAAIAGLRWARLVGVRLWGCCGRRGGGGVCWSCSAMRRMRETSRPVGAGSHRRASLLFSPCSEHTVTFLLLLHPQHSITAPDAQIHPGRVHGMSTRRSTGSPATLDRGDSKCVNAQIFSTGSCHYVHLDLSCSCHGRPGLSLHLLSYALPGAETTL